MFFNFRTFILLPLKQRLHHLVNNLKRNGIAFVIFERAQPAQNAWKLVNDHTRTVYAPFKVNFCNRGHLCISVLCADDRDKEFLCGILTNNNISTER